MLRKNSDDRKTEREEMVSRQLMYRHIVDERVLDAFRKVPRHEFIPDAFSNQAYEDHPLPIGCGQTISQPYMVASMTELLQLKGDERVLEIGTGSGYQTAILAELCRYVYTIERIKELSGFACSNLKKLEYSNITFQIGDGTKGWPEHAPYDGIIVTAGAPILPQSLVSQLKTGGRMVIPIGSEYSQILTVIIKKEKTYKIEEHYGCMFVPLIGEEGWKK